MNISTIFFAKDDFTLSPDATEELKKHISCANAVFLEVVVVVAFGDSDSDSDNTKQITLAANRGIEIRKFLIDAGIPEQRIYSEPRLVGNAPSEYVRVARGGRLERVAVVETLGNCKSIAEGNDCRVLCKRNY